MGAQRILIVGGGVAGLATARALGRAGQATDVVLLEAEAGLAQHSSGLNAGILRTAIGAPWTRRMALDSADRMGTPEVEFGPRGNSLPLLDPVGLLVAEAGQEQDPLPDWVAEHLTLGAARRIGPDAARGLAPHWRPAGARVWHLPGQGRIDISALLGALAAGARAGGVQLRTGARVVELLLQDGRARGVRLASGEELHADQVVLATGGWTEALTRAIGGAPKLRITRRHLLVTARDPKVDGRWPVVWDDQLGFYARPESGGLLLCGCEIDDVDPDRLLAEPEVKLTIARKTAQALPSFADAGVAHFWPGLRTLAPDDTPLIGPDPRCPGLFWVAGLGGHGMTLALTIGEVAADLLLDRKLDPGLRTGVDPARLLPAPRTLTSP
jgi:D-arginine dehydrogenase